MRPLLPESLPRFGARLGLATLGSVGIWWLLREPFGAAFRFLGNLVVAGLGCSDTVSFIPPKEATLFEPDAQIVYVDSGKALLTLAMASFRFAYTPLAVVYGLAFAARQWKLSNWRRLLLGLAVVLAYSALSIGIVVLHFGLAVAPVAFQSLATFENLADVGHTILGFPGFQYAIPAVIWYACTASVLARASGEQPAERC